MFLKLLGYMWIMIIIIILYINGYDTRILKKYEDIFLVTQDSAMPVSSCHVCYRYYWEI